MKLLVLGGVLGLVGCVGLEEPDENAIESEVVPTSLQGVAGQGTSMQGTSMQGTSMQGTSMQGTSMQGTSMQGSYGGSAVSDAEVAGTQLIFWKKVANKWEQRFPNKICYWNKRRTVRTSCTSYPLSASPLNGSTWPSTFVKKNADGTTTSIAVKLTIVGVSADTSTAMHALVGSDATGAVVSCENPNKCRVNSDLFLYDVRTDVTDANGQLAALCPTNQRAFALAGTWNDKGVYTASTSQFMFACTNGTIAKCTRWGYRPWASAIPTGGSTAIALRDYHSACVYAATADYCASGKSSTKDGTLVDIFDYTASWEQGFVPLLDGFVFPDYNTATAFAFEAEFDKKGAIRIDHARYAELAIGANSIESICPGVFDNTPAPELEDNYIRYEPSVGPTVMVNSTPSCAHSEQTVGKWMHRFCSECTRHVPTSCTDPATGWTQACVDYVNQNSQFSYQVCYGATNRTAVHSECRVGVGLGLYDTGCTLKVCLENPSCCSSAGWTASCVALADTRCTGGRENSFFSGFCGNDLVIGP